MDCDRDSGSNQRRPGMAGAVAGLRRPREAQGLRGRVMRLRWHSLRRKPSSGAATAPSPRPAGRLRRLLAEHGIAVAAIAFGVVITIALRVQLLGYRSGDLYDC